MRGSVRRDCGRIDRQSAGSLPHVCSNRFDAIHLSPVDGVAAVCVVQTRPRLSGWLALRVLDTEPRKEPLMSGLNGRGEPELSARPAANYSRLDAIHLAPVDGVGAEAGKADPQRVGEVPNSSVVNDGCLIDRTAWSRRCRVQEPEISARPAPNPTRGGDARHVLHNPGRARARNYGRGVTPPRATLPASFRAPLIPRKGRGALRINRKGGTRKKRVPIFPARGSGCGGVETRNRQMRNRCAQLG